jgi:hypothetical protein
MPIKFRQNSIQIPHIIGKCYMKSYIVYLILIFFVFPANCLSQNGDSVSNNIELISRDSLINGYFLKPLNVLPFSPVIEPEFNLPDTSIVSIFFMDTLQTDTVWIIKEESILPGLYKILLPVSGENEIILQIEAVSRSRDYIGKYKEMYFKANYQLLLP